VARAADEIETSPTAKITGARPHFARQRAI